MTEEYLIAHKCRGELSIDVAIQLEGAGTTSDPGPWWIIKTTGGRAYPFWAMTLDGVYVFNKTTQGFEPFMNAVPEIPDGHPDHFSVNDRPFSHRRKITDLTDLNLEDLGL